MEIQCSNQLFDMEEKATAMTVRYEVASKVFSIPSKYDLDSHIHTYTHTASSLFHVHPCHPRRQDSVDKGRIHQVTLIPDRQVCQVMSFQALLVCIILAW